MGERPDRRRGPLEDPKSLFGLVRFELPNAFGVHRLRLSPQPSIQAATSSDHCVNRSSEHATAIALIQVAHSRDFRGGEVTRAPAPIDVLLKRGDVPGPTANPKLRSESPSRAGAPE